MTDENATTYEGGGGDDSRRCDFKAVGLELAVPAAVPVAEANWIEARSWGEALVTGAAKESLGLATRFDPFPSFVSSDAVCVETDNAPRLGTGDLRAGEEVGDGDGDWGIS